MTNPIPKNKPLRLKGRHIPNFARKYAGGPGQCAKRAAPGHPDHGIMVSAYYGAAIFIIKNHTGLGVVIQKIIAYGFAKIVILKYTVENLISGKFDC